MKRFILMLVLLAGLLPLMALTTPRMYVQKLLLDNGKNPTITWDEGKSAKEYTLKAWINTRPNEVVSTDKSRANTISVRQVGDGKKFPFTVVASLQLGNFPTQWQEGEVIHMELTHRKTGQKYTWKMPIPTGSAVIMQLEKPIVIPPYKSPKK